MRKLLCLLFFPFFASAQVNTVLQKTVATGTVRSYSVGAAGTDTLAAVRLTAVIDGQSLIYNSTTKKFHATSLGISNITGLQDSLTDLVHKTGDQTITGIKTLTNGIVLSPLTAPAYIKGKLFYDSAEESLAYYDDISGTTNNINYEQSVRAINNTGLTISNGQVVYITGAIGQNPTIALAKSDNLSTSVSIGIATHDIANNTTGKITTFGLVHELNTSAFVDGAQLYLSSTVAGGLTSTPPSSPNYLTYVCTVLYSHISNGKLFIRPEAPISLNTALTDGNNVSASVLAVKTALDLKAPIASPTFTGTVTMPSLYLPSTTSSTTGIIFKNEDRWAHDFTLPGTDGNNIFIGKDAGNFTLTGSTGSFGSYNTGIGSLSLGFLTTGSNNTAVGYQALAFTTTGKDNAAFGQFTLRSNTSGNYNAAFGLEGLLANTTGEYNASLGYQALTSNTTGTSNTAAGADAMEANTTGNLNTSFGYQSLLSNIASERNAAFGASSLSQTTGGYNTGIGTVSLFNNKIGTYNTAVGYQAGYNASVSLDSLTHSTFLGNNARASVDGLTNSMALGDSATVDASNQVVIGNGNVTQTVLRGTMYVPKYITNSGTGVSGVAHWTIRNQSDALRAEFGLIGTDGVNTGSDLYLNQYLDNGTSVRIFRTTRATGATTFDSDLQATKHITTGGSSSQFVKGDGTLDNTAYGTGSVSTVSVVSANGVSGSVATATTTPAITLSLGAITPSSVASVGAVSGSTGSFTTSVNTPIIQSTSVPIVFKPNGVTRMTLGTDGDPLTLAVPLTGTSATFTGNLSAANLSSGTYTPTLTNVSNISSSTAYVWQYQRIGNTVTIWGEVDFTMTATAATELGISLPIASNFSDIRNVTGTMMDFGSVSGGPMIPRADITNDRISATCGGSSGTSRTVSYSLSYVIL